MGSNTNKKLEEKIGETFEEMNGIVNETIIPELKNEEISESGDGGNVEEIDGGINSESETTEETGGELPTISELSGTKEPASETIQSVDEKPVVEETKTEETKTEQEKTDTESSTEESEKINESPLNLKGAVLYTVTPMMGFNNKSLPGEILDILGVENIADNLIGDKPIISQEFLLKKNPDFLAGAMSIKSAEDIANSNPAVKESTAGKKGNFFIVDSSKILRGSPRIFEAVEEFYLELLKIKKQM